MTDGLTQARTARDAGMANAEAHRGADQDIAVLDNVIRHLAHTMDTFSANDARELLPEVAGQLIGARFNSAAGRRLIERVGDTTARHEAGHCRRISVWRIIPGADWSPRRRKQVAKQPVSKLLAAPGGEPSPEPAEPGVQSALF